MEIEEMKDEDLWELCQMTSDCFSEKAIPPKKEKFYRHYQNSKCKHFVIKNEGKIVSSITIFEVNMKIGNKVFVVGGIGDVVTEKSNRNKHYSSKLLEYCFNYMKKQHYPLTMLHASLEKYQKHYEKFGYNHMRSFTYNLKFDNLEKLREELKSDLKGKFEEINISENKEELMKMHVNNKKYYNLTIDYEKNDYFDKWVKSELSELNEKKESKIFSYIDNNDNKVKGCIAMSINKESESEIEIMIKILLIDNRVGDKEYLKQILFGLLYEKSMKLGVSNKIRIIYKIPEGCCRMCGIDDKGSNNYKVEGEYDDGWMYKILLEEELSEEDVKTIKGVSDNVIFRIDNF